MINQKELSGLIADIFASHFLIFFICYDSYLEKGLSIVQQMI